MNQISFMIINIEGPYKEFYNRAYVVNSQNRDSVCLYNTESQKRTTTSYARYKMTVYLNRFLTDEEHVDHIDNDETNDNLSNLQILSHIENNRKYFRLKGNKLVEYKCPVCNTIFSIRRGLSHLVNKNKKSVTCSRSCGGKISHLETKVRIIMLREYTQH